LWSAKLGCYWALHGCGAHFCRRSSSSLETNNNNKEKGKKFERNKIKLTEK